MMKFVEKHAEMMLAVMLVITIAFCISADKGVISCDKVSELRAEHSIPSDYVGIDDTCVEDL